MISLHFSIHLLSAVESGFDNILRKNKGYDINIGQFEMQSVIAGYYEKLKYIS